MKKGKTRGSKDTSTGTYPSHADFARQRSGTARRASAKSVWFKVKANTFEET